MLTQNVSGRSGRSSLKMGLFRGSWLVALLAGMAAAFGVSTAAANPTTVGATKGDFSVDLSGAATYQIPIVLPPGVHGMQPSLAMNYSSSSGLGLLGEGWALSGVSMISRCPKTIDQDGINTSPTLSTSDGLCLNGQRLVATAGTYGTPGSVYQTELDTFTQVTAGAAVSAGPCALGAGPASFSAVDREGKTYQYGTTTDSTLTGTGYSTGVNTGVTWCTNPTRLVWPVTRITDKYGNFISFKYYNLQNGVPQNPANFYVQEIDYGSASSTVGRVVFSYAANNNSLNYTVDTYQQYIDATLTDVNPVLMTGVQVFDNSGNQLRSYTLAYSAPYNSQQPAELTSVTECGYTVAGNSSSLCYPPTLFSYQGSPAGFAYGNAIQTTMPTVSGTRKILDLNGDGMPDYLYASGSGNEFYVIFGNNLLGTPVDAHFTAQSCNYAPQNLMLGNCNFDLSPDALVVSVLGDNTQQLMLPYYYYYSTDGGVTYNLQVVWKLLSWNKSVSNPNITVSDPPVVGGGQLPAPQCVQPFPTCGAMLAIDLTGTGYSNIVFSSGGYLYFFLNNGQFNPTPIRSSVQVGGQPRLYQVNYSGSGNAEMYATNTGIVQAKVQAQGPGRLPVLQDLILENGNHFDDSDENSLIFFSPDGSGLTSAIWIDNSNPADNQWWYYPNTGSGWSFPFGNVPNYNYATCDTSGSVDAQPFDWYGDGRQEILFPSNGTWHLLGVYNGTIGPGCSDTGVPVAGDAHSTQFIDMNADGFPDLTYSSGGYYYYVLNSAAPYVVSRITNGLGINTNVDYVTLSQAQYTSFISNVVSPAISPGQVIPYAGAMYLARDFVVDSGIFDSSGTPQRLYTYYKYGGPAVDLWGRGFLGFSEVETVNYNTGLFTVNKYSQSFPTIGFTLETDKYLSSQANLSPQPTVIPGTGGGGIKCFFNKQIQEPDCTVPVPPQYEPAQFDVGNLLSQTITTPASLQPYPSLGIYAPYNKNTTKYVYELVSPTASQPSFYEEVQASYDYEVPSGGTNTPIGTDVVPLSMTTVTIDAGNANDVATVVTTNTYGYEGVCPGKATNVQVTDSFNESNPQTYPAKNESYQYDSNCGLTQDTKTIVAPSNSSVGSQTLTKTFSYTGSDPYTGASVSTAFGETISETVSGTGLVSRTTYQSYDPTLRFPISATNALGQTETVSYDDWGSKLTDQDANGDQVTYAYDAFERKILETGPEPGVSTNWTYGPCVNSTFVPCLSAPGIAYAITQNGSDGSTTTSQYDPLGRVIRTTRAGFNNTTMIGGNNYDLLGRTVGQHRPDLVNGSGCWTFSYYDVLNRVIKKTDPTSQNVCAGWQTDSNDRVTTISYNGLTTTTVITNPNNTGGNTGSESGVSSKNILNQPAIVTDAAGNSNTYSYDPWGNLVSVTSPGASGSNTVSMTYDSGGRKLSMQDPDMGAWSYSYDAAGGLLTQLDAKGQTVGNTYDLLGRITQRTEPEGTSTWTYDVGYGAGIGRLAYQLSDNGVWEGYAYDAYGHPTDKITVSNGQEYWVTSTYDSQGRVSQVVYPTLTGINVGGTPGTPTGLSATQNSADVVLNWTATQNGAIYYVYRTLSTATSANGGVLVYSGPDSSALDSSITQNGTYAWWLKACFDTTCSAYLESNPVSVVLPPSVPQAPQVPFADTHQPTIAVSWPASNLISTTAGPISYVLQETLPSGSTNQLTFNTNSANLSLPADGTYSFAVRACASNSCSAWSNSTSYTTYIQPTAPASSTASTNISPTDNPATFNVSWTGSSVVPSSGITYIVQQATQTVTARGITKLSPFTQQGTVSVPGTTAANATAGLGATETLDGTYVFQVQACNTAAPTVCSAASTVGTYVVTVPPTQPGAISFTPASDDHTGGWAVNWGGSTLSSGSISPITYSLTELLNGSYYQSWSGTANSSGPLYHQPSGTYTYAVQACSTSSVTGNQACSANTLNNTGFTAVITPPPPGGLNVQSQSNWDGSYTVSWNSDAPFTVTSYDVELGENLGCEYGSCQYLWHAPKCVTTATSCVLGTSKVAVPSPVTHLVQIAAYNQTYTSGYTPGSNWPSVTVQTVTATGLGTNPSGTSTNGNFTVTWTAVSGAANYQVYQSVNGGAYTQLGTTGNSSYPITGGANGSTYTYYVIPCSNSYGCGLASATVSETVLYPPAPPTGLGISPGTSTNGGYGLSWNASATATQYRIYLYEPSPNAYVWVDTVGAQTSRAEQSTITGTYYYFVTACNASGCSSNSNVASVAVHVPPAAPSLSGDQTSCSESCTVNLSWSTGDPSVTSYQMTRNGNNSTTCYGNITSCAVSIVRPGSFNFVVIATNAYGSTSSNTWTVTVTASGCTKICNLVQPEDDGPLHRGDYLSAMARPVQAKGRPEAARLVQVADNAGAGLIRSLAQLQSASAHAGLYGVAGGADVHAVPAVAPDHTRSVGSTAVVVADKVEMNTVEVSMVALPLPYVLASADTINSETLANLPDIESTSDEGGNGMVSAQSRVAFFVTHAGVTSKPREHGLRRHVLAEIPAAIVDADAAHVQWPPKPIDPILSLYPPLRLDPRVAEHFESMGGVMPAKAHGVSSSEPTPSALMVQYLYNDPHGYLTSVVKLNASGTAVGQLWVAEDMNGYGIVDRVGFDAPVSGGSPALQIQDSYDPATGMLDTTSVTALANQTVSAQYKWDGYNDLASRSVGQNGTTALSETFTYDNLNRLFTVATTAGTYSNNEQLGYYADGSINANTGYSNYSYVNPVQTVGSYNYAQPHAIGSVTLPNGTVRTFQYDQNGNLTVVKENGSATKTVTWSSFNKPTQMQNLLNGGETETFVYNASHDRISNTLTISGSTDTTTYIDGLFETEVNSQTQLTTYRHYIVIGSSRIGVETITANGSGQQQSDTLGFFVHDAVGSVIGQVTENLGGGNQQLALYSYDVWGKERPVTTNASQGQTAYQDLTADQFIAGAAGQHEGFAGHENMPAIGLVEMEGRIYDPEIGRFLSPDPNVQYPLSTQGYNRYTYVNDNPLSLNDPSGFLSLDDVLSPLTSDDDAVMMLAGFNSFHVQKAIQDWVYRQLTPQEFALVNMIGSAFCGPFAMLCAAAGTYEYERANGVPADEALRAGVAAGIEEYATEEAGGYESAGFKTGSATLVGEGALWAYAGGYASARIEGGDAALGGRRALLMYGLKVSMDAYSGYTSSMDTAKSGGVVKSPNSGVQCPTCSNTGTEIDDPTGKYVGVSLDDISKDPEAMDYLSNYNQGKIIPVDGHWAFAATTEGGSGFEWAAMNIPGVNAFSVFHDQWMMTATNSAWIMATIPFAAYLSYASLGGYTQYYIALSPNNYH